MPKPQNDQQRVEEIENGGRGTQQTAKYEHDE